MTDSVSKSLTVWDSMKESGGVSVIRCIVVNGKRVVRVKTKTKGFQLEIDALLESVEGETTEIVDLEKNGKEKKVEIRENVINLRC